MALKFLLTLIVSVAVASAGTGIIQPRGHITFSKTAPVQYIIHPGKSLSSQFITRPSSSSQNYQTSLNIRDSISEISKPELNGQYPLIDPNGVKRIVQYTSHSINEQGVNNVRSLIQLGKFVANEKPMELPYVTASAQEIDYEPVVKGAYAVKPIVRAVPIAYPTSREH